MASAAEDTLLIQQNADTLDNYYNRCRGVSHRLADSLRSQGSYAQVLRCEGLRTKAPGADERWHTVSDQQHWVHFLVQIDGQRIVDLTRRQFFPDCDNPFYQTVADLNGEWDKIEHEELTFGGRFRS